MFKWLFGSKAVSAEFEIDEELERQCEAARLIAEIVNKSDVYDWDFTAYDITHRPSGLYIWIANRELRRDMGYAFIKLGCTTPGSTNTLPEKAAKIIREAVDLLHIRRLNDVLNDVGK